MDQGVIGAAAILAHAPVAALAIAHDARARAQPAPDLPIRELLVEPGFGAVSHFVPRWRLRNQNLKRCFVSGHGSDGAKNRPIESGISPRGMFLIRTVFDLVRRL